MNWGNDWGKARGESHRFVGSDQRLLGLGIFVLGDKGVVAAPHEIGPGEHQHSNHDVAANSEFRSWKNWNELPSPGDKYLKRLVAGVGFEPTTFRL
jgi:hypothetical protein